MSLHRIAGRSTVTPTAVRAGVSVFSIAGTRPKLKELSVSNTTVTATALALKRFTNATGVGTGLTEIESDADGAPPLCTAFAGHTADGGVETGEGLWLPLGAAIGATFIWTFDEDEFTIPVGTANGFGIIAPTGITGQVFDYNIAWEE